MQLWKKIFSAGKIGSHKDRRSTKIFTVAGKKEQIAEALPAVLKVLSGVDAGREVPLGSAQVNIGRMTASELLLNDTSVSRLHAFVVNEDGHHVLYDGKSTNGTFLNNQRINNKTLRHGDIIKIGNTVIAYELR
jgi:pSer/pThr/pTyr-binding forkhead associated (FHA) protein